MKIKKVCELTGLSDRAVRFYIEQELIFPHYEENYLGRRFYDFCEKDIEDLKNISILRKFGFTVVEIKMLIDDSSNSLSILPKIYARKISQQEYDKNAYQLLCRLNDKNEYTIDQIAGILREPLAALPAPKEEPKQGVFRGVFEWIIVLVCAFLIGRFNWSYELSELLEQIDFVRSGKYDYPLVEIDFTIYLLAAALLVCIILIVLFFKHLKGIFPKAAAVAICIALLTVASSKASGIQICSYTQDPANYNRFDNIVAEIQNKRFEGLFPEQSNYPEGTGVYSYYYRSYQIIDIYAEWYLDEESFKNEVERVKELYDSLYNDHIDGKAVYGEPNGKKVIYQKGDYTLYTILYGMKDIYSSIDYENRKYVDQSENLDIFVADANVNFGHKDYYDCAIFAFNEKTGNVRYSFTNGYSQDDSLRYKIVPFYTQQQW